MMTSTRDVWNNTLCQSERCPIFLWNPHLFICVYVALYCDKQTPRVMMQLRILWRQKTQIAILHLFLRHIYFFTETPPANKLEKITWIFHFSLKTSAQAHVNCRLVNTLYRKKRCTGLVSKTLQAFLYFLWHGQHPGILSPFTSYLCVTQIPPTARFATHFDFPSCWTGIFGPFSGLGSVAFDILLLFYLQQ